jgi:hypothetical protein
MAQATQSSIESLDGSNEPPNVAGEASRVESRRRIRYNAALKLLRRTHLFAGLFMTPWVFLYGVTGFLFNHPDVFSDRAVRTADRPAITGTALEGFPTAPELADRVVAALNERAGASAFRLVNRESAAYSRTLFLTATGRDGEHSVRFDPDTGEAFIRSTAPARTAAAPWTGGTSVRLDNAPRDRLAAGIPALLARLGLEADATAVHNPPDLLCTVEQGGQTWRVAYNLQTGVLSARPANDQASQLSTRRFLTGLHLAFTYPSRRDARWFWAVAVDAMFVAMVFWGISGILMWWQMKKLRNWGILTLIVSAAVAAALAAGMHEVLALRA